MVDQCQSKCGRRWEQLWKGSCMFPPWFFSRGVNEPAPVLLACTPGKGSAPGKKRRRRNGFSTHCQPDWCSKSPASPSQQDSLAVGSLFVQNRVRGKWNTWVKRKDPSYRSLRYTASAPCLCPALRNTPFWEGLLSWRQEDRRSWRQSLVVIWPTPAMLHVTEYVQREPEAPWCTHVSAAST